MKTNNIKNVLIPLLILALCYTSFSLYKKSKLCESCKFEKTDKIELPGNSDLSLKINLNDSENFQPFQYDIVNSYAILGKLDLVKNSDKVQGVLFGTLEAQNCKRFRIDSVIHDKRILNGVEVDWFTLKINNSGSEGGNTFKLDKSISLEKGDVIYTQVVSDNDKRIETRLKTANGTDYSGIFPPYICQGKIQ